MPFLISLLTHLAAITAVILLGGKNPEVALPSESKLTNSKPKKNPSKFEPPQASTVELSIFDLGVKKASPKKALKCPDGFWYGGVGISHEMQNVAGKWRVIISEVAKGYPAYEAGVRVRDELLNPDDLLGEVGSTVEIQVKRNGTSLIFLTTRAKICTS